MATISMIPSAPRSVRLAPPVFFRGRHQGIHRFGRPHRQSGGPSMGATARDHRIVVRQTIARPYCPSIHESTKNSTGGASGTRTDVGRAYRTVRSACRADHRV